MDIGEGLEKKMEESNRLDWSTKWEDGILSKSQIDYCVEQ